MTRDHDLGPDVADHPRDRGDELAGDENDVVLHLDEAEVADAEDGAGFADLALLLIDRAGNLCLAPALFAATSRVEQLPIVRAYPRRQHQRGGGVAGRDVMGDRAARLVERIGGMRGHD